jgi:hypothetical protein
MGIISTQAFTFRLIADGTQLDIFQDEDILISNNITGLFDIGVLPAEFTRQITLPGTKVNNAFFEHVYDISIDSPFLFATNIKVPAYIDFDSVYVIQGYIQLNKVNLLANKFIESYEITLFGSLSSFARDINRNYLTDLSSLAKYNHTSSLENITGSWSGSLFNGDIVYPLAEYGQQISYTPEENNFGIDSEYGGLSVQDFKPAIRVKPVLDAIFKEAGYTYSSSFMQEDWLNDVYMVCNNQLKYPVYSSVNAETEGLIKIAPISGSNMTDVTMSVTSNYPLPWLNVQKNPAGNMGTNNVYHNNYGTELRGVINLNFNISGSGTDVPQFYLKYYNVDTTVTVSQPLGVINDYLLQVQRYNGATGTRNQNIETSQQFNSGYLSSGSYQFQLQWSSSGGTGTTRVVLDPGNSVKSYFEINKATSIGDNLVMNIPLNMPYGTQGIKQIDFILGLQKKFNLVIYPNRNLPNQFIIETFNNWYNKGQVKDFNRYINLDKSIDVIPANNLAVNKLNFGDSLDTDYISQQFAKQANREFGKQYYTDTNNFYSQGSFDVKTTFASNPLLRLAGTGLSGSVGGINPPEIAYPVNGDGLVQLSTYGNFYDVCSSYYSPQRIVYSTTGLIEVGAVLYFDAYGSSLVTGYQYVVNSNDCEIWDLNPANGVVGTRTHSNCSDFGGCI